MSATYYADLTIVGTYLLLFQLGSDGWSRWLTIAFSAVILVSYLVRLLRASTRAREGSAART